MAFHTTRQLIEGTKQVLFATSLFENGDIYDLSFQRMVEQRLNDLFNLLLYAFAPGGKFAGNGLNVFFDEVDIFHNN